MSFSPVPGLGEGDTFTRRIYTLSLGRQGESRELILPVPADAGLPSSQNNPYAKVAYFGAASSDSLQGII